MSKYAYIRVSTTDQNTDRQHAALTHLDIDKIYEEKISGKDTNRPQLQKMLQEVKLGDTVCVESYSRLARSTIDLLNIIEQLKAKGVGFYSQKEQVDTNTPNGQLMLTIFAGIAQFEREMIKQRQREGINAAKAAGKHLGRPTTPPPENWLTVKAEVLRNETSVIEALEKLKISRTKFYSLMKE